MDIRIAIPAAALAIALAVPATQAQCVGDCHSDGEVTTGEVMLMVHIVLDNAPVEECGSGDGNNDGVITIVAGALDQDRDATLEPSVMRRIGVA